MLITVNGSSSFYQMAALPFSLTVILRSGRQVWEVWWEYWARQMPTA